MLTTWRIPGSLALLLFLSIPAAAVPLGRSFTYQGQLSNSGTPVEGTVHLRFTLWNMAGAGEGVVVGVAQLVPDVPVSGGIFSVELNANNEFGNGAFTGDARWLQVEVCTDAACTSTTVLSPRQALTAAPFAVMALGPWQLSGTSVTYTGGNVGIGTASPAVPLHVKTTDEGLRLEGPSSTTANMAWVGFANSSATSMGFVGDASSQDSHIYLGADVGDVILYSADAGAGLIVKPTANVGIGTASPAGKLDVRGDIRLGSNGQYRASGGTENLRLLRGSLATNGSILGGSGFTASRVLQGTYRVNYSTAFSATPSVTVTPRIPTGGALRIVNTWNVSTTGFNVTVYLTSGSVTDSEIDFCVMGAQ